MKPDVEVDAKSREPQAEPGMPDEHAACHVESQMSEEALRDRPGKILVADGDQDSGLGLTRALRADGHLVHHVDDLGSAMNVLNKNRDVDLILADFRLPGQGVGPLLERLGGRHVSRPVPVIILNEDEGMGWVLKSLSSGAADFVRKPFAPEEMLARVKKALIQSRTMHFFYQAAHRDHLTGLYNSRILTDMLGHEMSRARREKAPLSLLFADLDHFKKVNDAYGHLVGDQVLREFARRLCDSVRESDLVARQGGEEFVVLAPDTPRPGAHILAERIRASMAEPVETDEGLVGITVSLGVASLDLERRETARQLMERADAALYRAKNSGRNQVRLAT